MSSEDHEELSPLHRLMTRTQLLLEANERAERNPDPDVRYDARVRVGVLRIMLSEMHDTVAEVAKDQVERILAKRAKQNIIVTETAVQAMKVV